MDNTTRKTIFKRAWERAGYKAVNFAKALKGAWAEYRATVLRTSETSKDFEAVFIKKDGSIREATGTLDLTKVPAGLHPKGLRTPPAHVFTYYDLDKQAWRSFRYNTLLNFKAL